MAKCVQERKVVLELTEDEARVVKFLTGNVTGNSVTTWRALADDVYQALNDAGVDIFHAPPSSGAVIAATGPLPPKD